MNEELKKEGMECQECHAWVYHGQLNHTFLDCSMVTEVRLAERKRCANIARDLTQKYCDCGTSNSGKHSPQCNKGHYIDALGIIATAIEKGDN